MKKLVRVGAPFPFAGQIVRSGPPRALLRGGARIWTPVGVYHHVPRTAYRLCFTIQDRDFGRGFRVVRVRRGSLASHADFGFSFLVGGT